MTKNEPDPTNLSRGFMERDHGAAEVRLPVGISPTSRQRVCGDIGMHIDRHGAWHHQGSPILRKELVKLFSTVLRRDDVGDHWLITPAEIVPVQVEDTAHVIVDLEIEGEGAEQTIRFQTLVGTVYTLSPEHTLRVIVDSETAEPSPYFRLNHGLEARLNRAVFYDLADLAVAETIDGAHVLGVWSAGAFHVIGDAP